MERALRSSSPAEADTVPVPVSDPDPDPVAPSDSEIGHQDQAGAQSPVAIEFEVGEADDPSFYEQPLINWESGRLRKRNMQRAQIASIATGRIIAGACLTRWLATKHTLDSGAISARHQRMAVLYSARTVGFSYVRRVME